MALSIQPQTPGVVAPAATAATALFKPGQVLEALVIGKTPEGLTTLKIGDVVITAQLPQSLPPGTTLQLQVKAAGPAPQLVMIGTPQLPLNAAPPSPAPALPLPHVQVVTATPQVAPPSPVGPNVPAHAPAPLPSGPAAPVATTPPPAPVPALSAPVQSGPGAPSASPGAPAPPVAAPAQRPAQSASPPLATPPVPPPAAAPGGAPSPAPIAESAQPLPAPGARGESTRGPVSAARVPAASSSVFTPQPVSAAPAPSLPAPAVEPAAAPAPPRQPQPAGPASHGTLSPAATMASPPPAVPSIVAQQQTASAPPSPVTTPQPPVPPAARAATAAAAPEPAAPSPLLVAQGAPKASPSASELPKPAPGVAVPLARPAPSAPTPAAALAQMVPEALARQNSIAPLLAALAAVVARPGGLPEPVLRAALQVLGQRVPVPTGGPKAQTLQAAVVKSGVYLEATLAKGTPVADLKSGLVALKGALASFLGGNPAPVGAVRQVAPPLRGLPPRAEATDVPPLPDTPREAARTLHSQADAALSRVKLMQLASLPDADPARAQTSELRFEVPFLVGQELMMAQFQVFRDRARRHAEARRGWTMRFAMNVASSGEIGAEVGLLGRSVSVALWAADPETAAALQAALPELAPGLAAIGLEPGAVRVRARPSEVLKPASGHYLDSRR